jgi:hypothetical protein
MINDHFVVGCKYNKMIVCCSFHYECEIYILRKTNKNEILSIKIKDAQNRITKIKVGAFCFLKWFWCINRLAGSLCQTLRPVKAQRAPEESEMTNGDRVELQRMPGRLDVLFGP